MYSHYQAVFISWLLIVLSKGFLSFIFSSTDLPSQNALLPSFFVFLHLVAFPIVYGEVQALVWLVFHISFITSSQSTLEQFVSQFPVQILNLARSPITCLERALISVRFMFFTLASAFTENSVFPPPKSRSMLWTVRPYPLTHPVPSR